VLYITDRVARGTENLELGYYLDERLFIEMPERIFR
jgi:hypothetical protein